MTLEVKKKILDKIIEHEGYRKSVYLDSLGKPTIGYGFLIEALELEEDICELILRRKVEKVINTVRFKFNWFDDMPEKVQDVIVNMCYQLGVNGFAKFSKTIEFFKKKEFIKASEEMLRSKWYMQTPNRAKELSRIIKSVDEGLNVVN